MITVCFIENIDPLGVHTGDSFCSAPMLTISEECQKRLQEQAYKIVDEVQVIGGTNVQFAHDPVTNRIIVIEINLELPVLLHLLPKRQDSQSRLYQRCLQPDLHWMRFLAACMEPSTNMFRVAIMS